MWDCIEKINSIKEWIHVFVREKKFNKLESFPKAEQPGHYNSLAAKDQIDKGFEYIRALDWAVRQKNIHNIAVTGPYGSGKSSVINTFLKMNKHIKTLRLSLAAFNISSQKGSNKHKGNGKENNKLEEEFLKQIFYSVSSTHIPESRYRRITPTGWFKSSALAVVIIATFLGYIYFFKADWFEPLIKKLQSMPYYQSNIIICFLILLVILLGCAISYSIKFCEKNVRIKEVDIFNAAVMRTKKADKRTVFNKYMDEIVYFFEKTKTKIVVIEDIDRFESTDIFVALRNLNIILNNNRKINGRVRFIYAIKDDLFELHYERNKFFDFTIPIIPCVSSSNSIEVLRESLGFSSSDNKSQVYDISSTFVNMVSPYLNDMRTILAICNEFIIFKKILVREQALELKDEKLLAIVIFKNLYPKEYSELEDEKSTSIIRRAFEDRQDYINQKNQLIEQYVSSQQKMLKQMESDALQSVKELKSALLMSLLNPPVAINYIEINNKVYKLADILDDSFDVDTMKCTYMQLNVAGSSVPKRIMDVEKYVAQHGDYFSRIEYLSENLNTRKEMVRSEIETHIHKLNDMRSLTMKEMIDEFGTNFLDDSVSSNEFLVFLLRNGYLDDTYENYINYFRPKSISSREMNFILGIRNHHSDFDFSFPLRNVAQVYDRLQYYEFKQKETLNFDLVDYLLTTMQYSTSEIYLMQQLSNNSNESYSFIKAYIERGNCLERFIPSLCQSNAHLWNDIVSDNDISTEKKYEYLVLILTYANIDDILMQDNTYGDHHPLSQFLTDHEDSLVRLSSAPREVVTEVINKLNISFVHNDLSTLDDAIKECIFLNNKFEMNPFMLRQLFMWKKPALIAEFEEKNYSAIQHLRLSSLLQRVNDDFANYITNVFLCIDSNTKEDINVIKSIINILLPEEYDLCIQVIDKVDVVWDNIRDCCTNRSVHHKTVQLLWQHLLSSNKIKCSIENVIIYFVRFNYDKVLDEYFVNNADQLLGHIDDPVVSDEFKNTVLFKISDNEVFKKFLHATNCEFNIQDYKDMGFAKVEIIVKENVFVYTERDYCQIKDISSDLSHLYAENNKSEFLASLSKITIDADDIEAYMDSAVFNIEEKAAIIAHFDVKKMTVSLAKTISILQFPIQKELADVAWPYLASDERIRLLLNQIDHFTIKEISSLLAKMGGKYAILVANKMHKYTLPYSKENYLLLDALLQKGYVSRCEIQRSNEDNKKKSITGYVKAIPRE